MIAKWLKYLALLPLHLVRELAQPRAAAVRRRAARDVLAIYEAGVPSTLRKNTLTFGGQLSAFCFCYTLI